MTEQAREGKYERPDGSRLWEYLAIFTCSLFSFSTGATIGWVSPTIVKLLEPESPIPFTPEDVSTMVAAASAGQLLASLFGNALVDRFGRRAVLLLGGLPAIVGSAIIMAARRVWMVHLARVLVGYSLGVCICVSPVYTGEVSSTRARGLAGASMGVMITSGILFAYAITPYLSIGQTAGTLMAVALVFEASFWWMPETPHYLAMVGRLDEAEAVLEKLRGRTGVSEELDAIGETVSESEDRGVPRRSGRRGTGGGGGGGGLRDLCTGRGKVRSLAIAFAFLVPQHFGGYFLILSYSELIFKAAGNAIPSHLATMAMGVSQLASAVLAGLLVDRLGRRPLVLGAGVASGLANALIGAYLWAKEYAGLELEDRGVLFLLAVLVQVFAFNCGLISVHVVVMSEVLATEVRGVGMSLVGTFGAVFGVLTSKLYIALAVTRGIGHSPLFLGFAVVVWASTVLLASITPETKGKTFSQIQRELER